MKSLIKFGLIAVISLLTTALFPASGEISEPEAKNIGHRVAAGDGEFHENLPEDSLLALRTALIGTTDHGHPVQYNPNFYYLEFDVQETADGYLVLFHDHTIKRMFPQNEVNSISLQNILKTVPKNYDELKIHDLTLAQLKTLVLKNSTDERIATLDDFLQGCLDWGLVRPIALEIKYLYSDAAREHLINAYSMFRENFLARTRVFKSKKYDLDPSGVSFFGFGGNVKNSFDFKDAQRKTYWCDRFKEAGFPKIYQALIHWNNLCS